MSITIHVPQPYTHKRYLDSMEHPGRPSKSVAGGWIADFVALKRAIMLCPFCVHKFNPGANHYEVWRNDIYSVAKCDDCKQHSRQIRTFIHQSNHLSAGEWMRHKPVKGRWAFLRRSSR
jgi:hypothetical protein